MEIHNGNGLEEVGGDVEALFEDIHKVWCVNEDAIKISKEGTTLGNKENSNGAESVPLSLERPMAPPLEVIPISLDGGDQVMSSKVGTKNKKVDGGFQSFVP